MEARPPLSNLPTGAFSPPRPTARATAWGTPVNQPTAVHSVESTLRVGSSGDHWTIGCEVEELRGHGANVWISSCPHRLPKSAHWLRRCVLPFRFARLLAATLCWRRSAIQMASATGVGSSARVHPHASRDFLQMARQNLTKTASKKSKINRLKRLACPEAKVGGHGASLLLQDDGSQPGPDRRVRCRSENDNDDLVHTGALSAGGAEDAGRRAGGDCTGVVNSPDCWKSRQASSISVPGLRCPGVAPGDVHPQSCCAA